jgi:hypothetical protein
MTPVVNGLNSEYEGSIKVTALNAGFGEGKQLFDQFGLPGHPSFVLIETDGEVVWRAFGPQSLESLQTVISGVLGGTETE